MRKRRYEIHLPLLERFEHIGIDIVSSSSASS